MKSIILLVLFSLLMRLSAFSQDDYYQSRNVRTETTPVPEHNWNIKSKTDSLEYQMAYMRFCMKKFHNNILTGITLEITGSIAFSCGSVLIDPNSRDNAAAGGLVIAGTGMMLTGLIMEISSYRWLRRFSIEPAKYGIGFGINF